MSNQSTNQDEDKKIFDTYEVHCEECQHYWDDSCEGTRVGSYKPCTAFVATKRIDLPSRVQKLEKWLKHVLRSILLVDIVIIIHLLTHIFGK